MKRSSSECWINLVICPPFDSHVERKSQVERHFPPGPRSSSLLQLSPGQLDGHSIVTIATGEWRSSITRPKTTLACGSNATTQPPFWIASPLCAVKVCPAFHISAVLPFGSFADKVESWYLDACVVVHFRSGILFGIAEMDPGLTSFGLVQPRNCWNVASS
ncbi:unnamed protein product [Mycena citricolor]|uniref:Uncharacterized protein n=1 Tax=Mycena citricolor TaxID=2018698 RepID=A0AAD2Q5J3_9AGAR|nr:unnamed protein product [Mycena citricolor]